MGHEHACTFAAVSWTATELGLLIHMLTEAGNPKSKLPLAPLSKIREVLRQIALQKQHYKPPESATKTPLDCLRELRRQGLGK